MKGKSRRFRTRLLLLYPFFVSGYSMADPPESWKTSWETHGCRCWKLPKRCALLDEAVVPLEAVQGGRRRLAGFIERYLPWFYRKEQRERACVVREGRLSNLERKTNEPIARQAHRPANPCRSSSAPASGTLTPCWPNSVVTWPRSGPTTKPC